MTKAIRVENADTSDYKVMLQVWDKGRDLGNGLVEPDTLVREIPLNLPTTMVQESIYDTRYLVIKEV